jgi:hypothetical protein
MARRIRIFGLVDIVFVADPTEIRALNDEPRIDRQFASRGPLVNRLICGQITRWFKISGEFLPSLVSRRDQVRAHRQGQLAAALDPACGRALWSDVQLERLVSFVSGDGTNEDAAITVQEIVGRLFEPSYVADLASWRAAIMIDRLRSGFSPIQIIWRIVGRLHRAHALLVERANHDRWAMHGTAIGVHGIMQALARMRQLRALPDAMSVPDDTVLELCLQAPKQVPRTVDATLSVPSVRGEIYPGTLVMLQLEAARRLAPHGEMVFMQGHWNSCPARAFVIALLQAVWHRSLSGGEQRWRSKRR